MSSFGGLDTPHRRLNPLTGETILVPAPRGLRPWRGQEDSASTEARPPYDPATPEAAAAHLRAALEIHFRDGRPAAG